MLRALSATRRAGFTLIELLVVIGILAVLAAILFPVFATARAKARQTQCVSNIRQIGLAYQMYADDHDEQVPFGIDATDWNTPQIWRFQPPEQPGLWYSWIVTGTIPYIDRVMAPYVKSPDLWRCPSDTGYTIEDFNGEYLDSTPTAFQKWGSSYLYRTELTFREVRLSALPDPAGTNVFMDSAGRWHGGQSPLSSVFPVWPDPRWRYNVLAGDLSVKNRTFDELNRMWRVRVH